MVRSTPWTKRLTVPLTLTILTALTIPLSLLGAPTARAAAPPPPLAQLFDNRAISSDAHPAEADFDGAGHSLSATDLAAAGWTPGARLDLDGTALTWPKTRPGAPDNLRCNGQRIAVPGTGTGTALTFLVAGTGPAAASGHGTVTYTDGSTSPFTLDAPDWRTGPLATKAVALPHLNSADGTRLDETARLYAVSVPLAPGRRVASVTLPPDPGPDADLHLFAAAVRPEAAGWSGSWATGTAGYTPVGPWRDRTLRLVVHPSTAGSRVRIKLANTFARGPVTFDGASVAVQSAGAAARGAPVPLHFGGRRGTTLAAGAEAVSDPAPLDFPAGANLLVSLHLPGTISAAPVHSEAGQTSYLSGAGAGDRTGESGAGSFPEKLTVWPFLTGVDVAGGPGSVVAFGDSITDGVHSTADADRRWPDVLAERLRAQSAVPDYGVLNEGISANRVTVDRYPGDGTQTVTGGVSAGHRFERDVLDQPRVRTVILFEGVNDIRINISGAQVIAGLRELAARAHARGIRVIGATVTPCGGGPDCGAQPEQWRSQVNAFVRHSGGAFDAVADFDAAVRDPADPTRIAAAYDSGDHLHPGDAGLRRMAESIDLSALEP